MKRRLYFSFLLACFINLAQAKTQHFDVYFKGISAGDASLTLPDVLTFPVLGSKTSKSYEVTLTLNPNTLASVAGQGISTSRSTGRLWADKIKPENYLQRENDKLVITGKFSDDSVIVKDLKKDKEYVFEKNRTVNDPLSLILDIQQGLRRKALADEYVIVDNKRLNHFSVKKTKLAGNHTRVTLTSKKNADAFVFVFNVAYDLTEIQKLKKSKIFLALKAK